MDAGERQHASEPAAMPRAGFARWRSDAASGGNRYDDELSAAFAAQGLDVREYPVEGSWPAPSPEERRRFAGLLHAERHWLIDNIVASAAPEAVEAATAEGRRITILVHYFPADDPSLEAEARERLAASEAAALSAASAVVASSRWAAQEVARRYGRDDTVAAVPGVEAAPAAPGSSAAGRPMLLWLGRLTETKDPLAFVEALRRVSDLEWNAEIVGPDTVDEPLSREVRARIAAAGLEDRVAVPGTKQGAELDEIWSRADLLVHTARAEVYGMVVSEALSRAIPAIVPDGTGAVEAQQGAGARFAPGDVDALAAVLRSWLTDPELRASWRAEAAERRSRLPGWQDAARIVAAVLAG